jgi:hypothetical protein
MMEFVDESEAVAYALPRDPPPIIRMRRGSVKVCLPGAERNALSGSSCGMAEGDMAAEVCLGLLRIFGDQEVWTTLFRLKSGSMVLAVTHESCLEGAKAARVVPVYRALVTWCGGCISVLIRYIAAVGYR